MAFTADRLIAFYDEADFKQDMDEIVNEEKKTVEKMLDADQMEPDTYEEKMTLMF